ncbi:thiol-disulfide oxidoreductase DCC family protein [Streptomyces sp. NPDC016845]|uniref:thiol-disulfide oxidoreductase DCC family protein n=1 Tax=Streptomyces sp. NPDC016845 TaxID=3364972 RepID=UPI003787F2AF
MMIQPALVFDGDCGFCTTSVKFAERWVRPRCEIVPWQFADLDALGTTQERAEYEALWVTPAGTVYGGSRAVAKALLSAGGAWPVLGALLTLPPVSWAAHGVYRLIAENRHRLPGGTAACAVAGRRPSERL